MLLRAASLRRRLEPYAVQQQQGSASEGAQEIERERREGERSKGGGREKKELS
jgi:hypothetical protein